VESAKLMRLAADELNTKAAMQIRYLETLKQVGRSNTKVIFIP
jgi:regulator of protease activity HflC (stomatin/prohibitin superfamily)